jgi:superfamily II DNA/RNA helicase
MSKNSDIKFFTNDAEDTLKSRFVSTLKDAKFFDILVGYFRTSGFAIMYPSLEGVEKIRILVGLNVDKKTQSLIQRSQQSEFDFNSKNINKDQYCRQLEQEVIDETDDYNLEISASKFIEFIKKNKLEIRVHPSQNIHAKVYITRYKDGDRDFGNVITGSSNFSQNGLVAQREFNVELKDKVDVKFALEKFEILWNESIEVTNEYQQTIVTKTWLNNQITPYEIYLKFLYEYFKEDFQNHDNEIAEYPENFKQLQYQSDAVNSAYRILNDHGGVFLSDVVGLGKTYMGTMLCKRLIENKHKKVLIIAPPHLIDKNNKGSWHNAFEEFHFKSREFECYSIGLLDSILKKEKPENYDIVLIDESHRFRSELTENYPKLNEICRGKKVILVSATPYNNRPSDLFSQIKLFQGENNSSIPNLKNIKAFFNDLEKNLKNVDRQENAEEYLKISKENAKKIREKILKHLMVRRTRTQILNRYSEDLVKQNITFPKVAKPRAIFYEFNDREDEIFNKTLKAIINELTYIRYIPKTKHKTLSNEDKARQNNMKGFMKTLLFKRLESSIDAFKKTIDRFIISYERFISAYQNGKVFVSKKHSQKIFDFLENGEDEEIEKLINGGFADEYLSTEFQEELGQDLQKDLQILKQISNWWNSINRDPKILAFKEKLANEKPFQSGKSIIFTESQETAIYLCDQLKSYFKGRVIGFAGSDNAQKREEVLQNFDANSKNPKDDFDILITTDVLAEGVNLHRGDVVVNYDLPWNPAKLMQRVGRINRVDTPHNEIFTYNFFPSKQSNDVIKLEESAKSKIASFNALLGNDAKLLTEDEEVKSHKLDGNFLYEQLMQNPESEEENDALKEIEYLKEIKKIAEENKELFEKIKRLPKKSRCARSQQNQAQKLISFLKRGHVRKFYLIDNEKNYIPQELDFLRTAEFLKADPAEPKANFDKKFFEFLAQNKSFFEKELNYDQDNIVKSSNAEPAVKLINILLANFKNPANFSDDEFQYLQKIQEALKQRLIPKKICSVTLSEINENQGILFNTPKFLNLLKNNISPIYLEKHYSQNKEENNYDIEVILSCYFTSN